MKKLIFVLVLFTALLVSCGETQTDDPNTVTLKTIDNLSEYTVVRSDNSSSEVTALATKLRKAINDATGASVAVKTDYNNYTYEILVGETKRQQSIDACADLRYYDYTVKLDGNKIVVAGGSEEALASAIDLFNTQFIDAEKKTVKIPSGKGYTYKGTYKFDKISVDGVDIGEFKLNNQSLLDITDLTVRFRDDFGADVAVHDNVMLDDEHYIIIDGTELIADKYSITVENGNLIIKGSAHALPTAIETFFGSFIDSFGSKSIDITSANNLEASTGKKDIYTKDQLMTVIEQVYDDPDKIIIGEQVQGGTKATVVADSIQKFVDATGEMPGIMGIDLACYGIDLTRTNDMQWSSYICDLVDYAAGGGMITASAHWANPSKTNDDRVRGNFGTVNTLEAYEQNFKDLLTEGTEYNEFFKNELTINARFFKALEDNGVSIIWRPLHEANGSWFWFCITQQEFTLDAKYYVDIWHYVYEYFTEECGLTNLLWCYGPNYSANVNDNPGSTMSPTYLYPGDEYVDMVGVDWYSGGNLEIMKGDNYLRLVDLARKPGAITEFGPSGSILGEMIEEQPGLYNSMDLYGNLYELTREGYSFVYLLTWGGKWGIPAMGRGDEFMATDLTIGQAEVKAMFDALG
ncbi:MAG: hypothetical protein IJZ89_06555 [Clostridia bacterium]|nr:hypothetical protein [Clostridia bacterium]